jgi:predicted metalloprotease with PDZ domain
MTLLVTPSRAMRSVAAAAVILLTGAAVHAQVANRVAPAPLTTPYPGDIVLKVDATDLDRKIIRVTQTVPVKAGPLTLVHPRWLPGQHSPSGDINQLAGLKISAGGKTIDWKRDPLDTHAFVLNVPEGVRALDIEFQNLAPIGREVGRTTITREMLNVQWQAMVLYPLGWNAGAITFKPALTLPEGWKAGTALRPAGGQQGNTISYQPVSLEMLVDSPVFAGRHFRRIELDPPGAARPVVLNIVADSADKLNPTEAQIEAHRELVRQADKVFASRHFAHYDFLFALSEELGGIGLEHHQSSENGVRPNYWEGWDKRIGARELLPHEYTHSWNGKFRRPADLNTPDFNTPMQTSLLWLYEGQTQYWGYVLAARSGLTTPALARDQLARTAAYYDNQAGRTWRNLQDTTQDAIMTTRRGSKDWTTYQRTGGDYYGEMMLVWLDADTLIREKTGGQKSLDDFAKGFFGVKDGELGPLPYTFEDIVAAFNSVVPHDWAGFLRQRLDSNSPRAPLDGLARGGWKLVYDEKPSEAAKADEGEERSADLAFSLGLSVGSTRGGGAAQPGADTRISSVQWGGVAFQAGIAPGATLLAVNNRAYKAEGLKAAITANKEGKAPIELLLREGDNFRTVKIDYRGGLRYPRLERVEGSEDRLGGVLTRR